MGDKLTIQLKGSGADENLTLEDFAVQIRAINTALHSVDKMIGLKKERSTYFEVINLSRNSPSAITIQAFAMDTSSENRSERVLSSFVGIVQDLNRSVYSSNMPRMMLEAFYELSSGLKNDVKEILFTLDDVSTFVTREMADFLASIISKEEVTEGSMRGTLDYINLHGNKNTFRIYPIVGPPFVTCTFSSAVREQAKAAIDKYVQVKGLLYYKTGEDFPFQIEAQDIEILPDDGELPSMFSIKGMAQLAANESSEEVLSRERDEQW